MADADSGLGSAKRAEILASFGRQGFLTRLGARIEALEAGRCVIVLPFSDSVTQQHGFFHGGAIGAVADSAGGYAAMTLAPPGVDVLAAEYKINFLRPAKGRELVAEGVVLRSGRTFTVCRVDVRVRGEEGETLCAAMQQSVVGTGG